MSARFVKVFNVRIIYYLRSLKYKRDMKNFLRVSLLMMGILFFGVNQLVAAGKKPVQYNEEGDIIKTGWNLGPLPVVAYDNDRGFQYGALLNLYNFGDGSTYPNPKSAWYFEASAYTKGTSKIFINYDNREIFKGVRLYAGMVYSNEKALDFYGLNGYQTLYDLNALNISTTDGKLQDKMDAGKYPGGFYRHSRNLIKAKAELQGHITEDFYWEAGYNLNWSSISAFAPDNYTVAEGSLYNLYQKWGIISPDQAKGGLISALRAGLMYDTRDREKNASKGIWAEAHVSAAPSFLGTTHPHLHVNATMRQYVPLVDRKLTFAYRAVYQGFFGKDVPWYALPNYTLMSSADADWDGLGGYRTVRGLSLNRVQGLQTAFANVELRWRFVDFQFANQNIAFALSTFCDGATVLQGFDLSNKNEAINDAATNALYDKFIDTSKPDALHLAAGGGFRFIMNENFIIAFELARCFDKRDGGTAFYINTGFLF